MDGTTKELTLKEVYVRAESAIRKCRAANPEKPGCGRSPGFPCWLDEFVPGAYRNPHYNGAGFCSGCLSLAGCKVRLWHEGVFLAADLLAAGVPTEAADLLDAMMAAHDEEGMDWIGMIVDAWNHYGNRHVPYGVFYAPPSQL